MSVAVQKKHATQNNIFSLLFSDSDICPVAMFKLYKSKLNDDFNHLWQRPKQGKLHYTDPIWFDKQRVGHDPLERYMKFLAKDVPLSSEDYTNHSIRATCITLLDRAQFESRHIIALTGHKSENTIKQYAKGCSNEKKRQMSNELASKIEPKKKKPTTGENTKITESATTPNAPSFDLGTFDFLPFEEDDDILMKYLNENPQLGSDVPVDNKAIAVPPSVKTPVPTNISTPAAPPLQPNVMTNTVQNVQNIGYPPIAPKFLFSNSNVTINYNFNSK